MQSNTVLHEDINQTFSRLFENILSLYLKKQKLNKLLGMESLKPKRTEIVEAFKNLDTFDEYINTNFESRENFKSLVVREIKIRVDEILEKFHVV